MMQNSSRFFRNDACRYFPCHTGIAADSFNCLFCFCPLYWMEDCGGAPAATTSGLKDCSNCTFPHQPESYPLILLKIKTALEKKSA